MKVCTIDGCDSTYRVTRGMCDKHYTRWRRHGDPSLVLVGERKCEVGDCTRKHKARGLCDYHYNLDHRANRPPCTAPDCGDLSAWGEHCWKHAERLRAFGSFKLPEIGPRVTSTGYLLRRDPAHPLARDGWLFEHRAVLHEAIGPGEHRCHWCGMVVTWDAFHIEDVAGLVVDHLDEDRLNNDPVNLVPSCGPCNLNRKVAS